VIHAFRKNQRPESRPLKLRLILSATA
jgi:hypothetical protein